MVSCCAYGCTNRSGRDKVSFHKFPADPELKALWIKAINRKDWTPSASTRICSDHFLPSELNKTYHSHVVHVREQVVPRVFPAFPKHLQITSHEKKPPNEIAASTKSSNANALLPVGLLSVSLLPVGLLVVTPPRTSTALSGRPTTSAEDMKRKSNARENPGGKAKKLADSIDIVTADNDSDSNENQGEDSVAVDLDLVKHEISDDTSAGSANENDSDGQHAMKSEPNYEDDDYTEDPLNDESFNRNDMVSLDADLIRKAIDAVKKIKDESNIFGDFVANEMRCLKSVKLRRKLQSSIQRAILTVAEEDEALLPQN